MANRLRRGMERLAQRLGNEAPVSIVYHRGNDSVSIPVGCWAGRTPFRTQDQLGSSRLEWSERDYMIPVELLVLDGQTVQPQEHDWIEEVFPEPEGSKEYELVAPNNEPVWRFGEQSKVWYRIHTKAKLTS